MKKINLVYIVSFISCSLFVIVLLNKKVSSWPGAAPEVSVDAASHLSCEMAGASATGLELLEIIQRIDRGDIERARYLAESYMDSQLILIEQISKAEVAEELKQRGSKVVERIQNYKAIRRSVTADKVEK